MKGLYAMATGNLVVIEGSDGAGKETQAKKLLEALEVSGIPATYFDFPRYKSSVAGALVGRCLKGDFGDFVQMPPQISAIPYILDRVGAIREIQDGLSRGIVLCNRYTPSNLAHQSAKLLTHEEREQYVAWLEDLEYQELGIPRPTLVVYLYVPLDISQALIASKSARGYLKGGATKDSHEKNLAFQQASIDQFRYLASTREDWVMVNCVEGFTLRSVESIHDEVRNVVMNHLGVR